MNDTNPARRLATKGFGTAMVARLREVDSASTEELAALAGVTPQQAYSRLSFLQTQEGLLQSAGKGLAKVWSMADKSAPPAPVKAPTLAQDGPAGIKGAFNHNHGWKPSMRNLAPVEDGTILSAGTKVLVQYPEEWRHSALLSLKRAPDADGVALCWDLRNGMCVYAPVTPASASKHGCRVVVVERERDLVALAA
jgi:hypothetical protein